LPNVAYFYITKFRIMKILTCNQIRQVDQYTITHEPIRSVDLMERASEACSAWISKYYDVSTAVKVFVGPGNNGGDGLAIARMLSSWDFQVSVYVLNAIDKFSPDALKNYNRLISQKRAKVFTLVDDQLPVITGNEVLIDALFGSGLSRPLDGLAAKVVKHMNNSLATIIAIDIPSGLFGENNAANTTDAIIRAHYTLTFQMPKLAFFFAENEAYVGKPVVLNIDLHPEAIQQAISDYELIEASQMKRILKIRPRFSHKGTYGHALLISGSYGKMGAAILAATACMRSGVGLLTIHIPAVGYSIVQIAVHEAMVSVDKNNLEIGQCPATDKYSAVGIGPGIGMSEETAGMLYELITNAKAPLVLDADALNIISMHPDWIKKLPENTVLTPHPREFERLAGVSSGGYDRHLKQIAFSRVNRVVVVLKGAYTSITDPEGHCWFNPTGNPGMATGGSGDVLTGIILSLLAQGYKSFDAACMGVYIHGFAGDLAAEELAEESLIASDIINNLGIAFKNLK
jgi:ADP-dependent NAD(P)H-hydrate dehydratase / NAD(P)H-hydrate epimerase